jgi:hypothetical protein
MIHGIHEWNVEMPLAFLIASYNSMLYNTGMLRKETIAGITALLMTTPAHASCVIAAPPVDKEGVDKGSLYYREKGSPGLLHVREKPNAKSRWIWKVEHGDILLLNDDLHTRDWEHVIATWSPSQKKSERLFGWVRSKYVKPFACPQIEEDPLNPAVELDPADKPFLPPPQ